MGKERTAGKSKVLKGEEDIIMKSCPLGELLMLINND